MRHKIKVCASSRVGHPPSGQTVETANAMRSDVENVPLINHMWTAPACEGCKFGFGEMVRCSHMSGPLVRCL